MSLVADQDVTSSRENEIEELYRAARQFSTPERTPRGDTIRESDRETERQRKVVYRWLLNHARFGRVELLNEFIMKSEDTIQHILTLRDEYVGPSSKGSEKASKDMFEKNGFTMLHVAALFDQKAVVEIILPHGKDKFKLLMARTEPQGWLALHLCTRRTSTKGENLEVVKYLLKAYFMEFTRLRKMSNSDTLLLRFKGLFHDSVAGMTPLHYATRHSNYSVVKEMLDKVYLGTITYIQSVDLFLLTPLHISALVFRDETTRTKDAFMTAELLIQAAKTKIHQSEPSVVTDISMLDICINALDCCSYTPLHWAAHSDALEIIKLLLKEEKVRTLEKDRQKKTPLHVAMESSRTVPGFPEYSTSSKKLLVAHPIVREDVDRRLQDRQISVDSSNAMLVGASLVASVTFAALLQPPLGWVTYYDKTYEASPPSAYRVYAAVGKDDLVKAFWALDCLSFLFAASTAISSSLAVRQKSGVHLREMVRATKRWLLVTSVLFTLSLLCVLGAFVVAGIAALPPSVSLWLQSFIYPGSIPFLLSVCFCMYLVYDFVCQCWRHWTKQWKHISGPGRYFRIGRVTTTVKDRRRSLALRRSVQLLTQSSDRFEISGIMQEIETQRRNYHRTQSPEDCRKEAIKVGAQALLEMTEIFQTPSDTWTTDALDGSDSEDNTRDSESTLSLGVVIERLKSTFHYYACKGLDGA